MAGYCTKTLVAFGSKSIFRNSVTSSKTYLCLFSSARNFSPSLAVHTSDDGGKPWFSSVQLSPQKVEFIQKDTSSKKLRPTVIRETDTPLARTIRTTSNVAELLEFIENVKSEDFNDRVIDVTAIVLFNHMRKESSDSVKKSVLHSIGMQKFCRVIKQEASSIDVDTFVNLCKAFVKLHAPGNHPTFEIVLRLLSKYANSMHLIQIIYLDYLLTTKLDPISQSPLTDALKLALPVVFESQLHVQLSDVINAKDLVDYMAYAVSHDVSNKGIEQISKFLSQCTQKFHYRDALNVLWDIGQLKHNVPELNQLLPSLFEILTAEIQKFNLREVGTILGKCARNALYDKDSWYNQDLVDACCHRLVEIGDDSILRNFKTVSLLRHVNLDMMEAVVKVILTKPHLFLNDEDMLLAVVRGFSGANYKPEKWNLLYPLLVEHPALTKSPHIRDISLTLDYLALDILPEILVRRIFSPNYTKILNKWIEKNGPHTLLVIAAAIKNFHPEYDGPEPSDKLIRKWELYASEKVSKSRPLEAALQTGLGGEAYVSSNIYHEGLFIDHCVVMRQGGYPVAINDCEPTTLNDVIKPLHSSLILIKSYRPENYARNTSRLRGHVNLVSKLLKNSGHALIEVELARWNGLSDNEKIRWIMKKIRENTETTPYNSY